MMPDATDKQDDKHDYVPTSRWTGDSRYPRWAVCEPCGWSGPVRDRWADAEQDFTAHAPGWPAQFGGVE